MAANYRTFESGFGFDCQQGLESETFGFCQLWNCFPICISRTLPLPNSTSHPIGQPSLSTTMLIEVLAWKFMTSAVLRQINRILCVYWPLETIEYECDCLINNSKPFYCRCNQESNAIQLAPVQTCRPTRPEPRPVATIAESSHTTITTSIGGTQAIKPFNGWALECSVTNENSLLVTHLNEKWLWNWNFDSSGNMCSEFMAESERKWNK